MKYLICILLFSAGCNAQTHQQQPAQPAKPTHQKPSLEDWNRVDIVDTTEVIRTVFIIKNGKLTVERSDTFPKAPKILEANPFKATIKPK